MAKEFISQKMPQIANITQNQVSVIIATCFWPGYWLIRTPSAHVVTVDRHVNITRIPRVICTIRAWTTWRIRRSSLSSTTINAIQNTLSSISRWRALMAFSEELVHLGRHHLRYPGDNFRRHIPRFKGHQNHCHPTQKISKDFLCILCLNPRGSWVVSFQTKINFTECGNLQLTFLKSSILFVGKFWISYIFFRRSWEYAVLPGAVVNYWGANKVYYVMFNKRAAGFNRV